MGNFDAAPTGQVVDGTKPSAAEPASMQTSQDGSAALILEVANVLFSNGQTTDKLEKAVTGLARKSGVGLVLFATWGELKLCFDLATWRDEIISAQPASVDMRKVAMTMRSVDLVCEGRLGFPEARSQLAEIARHPPVPTACFAAMAAAGAAALGVLFGATYLHSLLLIALSAGTGGLLRRWLARRSKNMFVQPFCAALLAGVIGAAALRWYPGSALRLVAVCPCMVLVPGPHLLNGALDLARGRIPLGLARLAYAGLTILMICCGLLMGLSLLGVNLPAAGAARAVPFGCDLVAAGVAVSAYGTFFSLPWRMLPVPVLVGMLAHACRWLVSAKLGASAENGTLVACLVAGTILTPVADRLKLPFAGLAFASVVSMIPGVFLFRLAGGLAALVESGAHVPADTVLEVSSDGATAVAIIVAMAFGLFIPKFGIEHIRGK